MGYQYRWDFDSNGEADTEWTRENHTQEHAYLAGDAQAYLLVASLPDRSQVTVALKPGKSVTLGDNLGITNWKSDPKATLPAIISLRKNASLELQPREANIAYDGRGLQNDQLIRVSPQDSFYVGNVKVAIRVEVKATLWVRNAFGNQRRSSERIRLTPSTSLRSQVVKGQ